MTIVGIRRGLTVTTTLRMYLPTKKIRWFGESGRGTILELYQPCKDVITALAL